MMLTTEGLNQEHSDQSLTELVFAWQSDALDLLSVNSQVYTKDWPIDEYTISWQILWTGHGTLLPVLQFVDDRDKMTDLAHYVRWKHWPEDWPLTPGLERRLPELESMLKMYTGYVESNTLTCKRLYSTQHGMMGLADFTSLPDDILFSLDGEDLRVLRPVDHVKGTIPAYRIIGHAVMYRPELLIAMKDSGVRDREIRIM